MFEKISINHNFAIQVSDYKYNFQVISCKTIKHSLTRNGRFIEFDLNVKDQLL